MKARKDTIIGQSRDGVEKWLRSANNVSVFQGHARFTGARSISVSTPDGSLLVELTAGEIFINTGTRAVASPLEGLEHIRYYTNSNLLDLTELPEHLVIVGGSYIALEFAQIFRCFGSRVTVLVRGEHILSREDADFAESVRKVLAREGIEFMFGVQPTRVELHPHRENDVCIGFEQNIPVLEASHLLFATGREPNTDDFGLDAAGIATDKHGIIPVDGQLRTNVPGVWAIGDVNGRGAFTHTSYDDYQIVAANLLDGGARIMAYALIATMPMTRVGHARERGETDGFMKALVDAKSKQILGAAIHGVDGDEAIHTFIDIMTASAPYPVLQYAMHIHPTISELVPTLFDGLKPMK